MRHFLNRQMLFPAGVALASIALAVAVFVTLHKREVTRQHDEAATLAREGLTHIQTVLQSRTGALTRMAVRWEIDLGTREELWRADARLYLGDIPEVQSIIWSDNNFIVRRIVDRQERDSILDLDQKAIPQRHAQLRRARARELPASSGPRTLTYGGTGFIYDIPLTFPDGAQGGYLHAVFDYFELVAGLSRDILDDYHAHLVVQNRDVVFTASVEDPALGEEVRMSQPIFGEDWVLALSARQPGVQLDRLIVPALLAGLCVLLGFLAAAAIYFRARAFERARLYLETHRRLQSAIDALEAPFAYFDSQDRLQNWNRAYSELNAPMAQHVRRGSLYETMLVEAVRNGMIPEARGDEDLFITQRMALHALPEFTVEREMGDGRWIKTIEKRTADGGTATLWTDITDQKLRQSKLEHLNEELTGKHAALKAARERLSAEETRFRNFAESSADWFWESDAEHRITWISGNIERIGGKPPEWYLGRSRVEMGERGQTGDDWQAHLQQLKNREPYRDVLVCHHYEHGQSFIRSSGIPQFDEAGNFTGYLGTGTDVTQLILAEERYDSVRDQLSKAISSISEGMLIFSPDDRLVLCNDNWRRSNPWSEDMITEGISFHDLMRRSAEAGLSSDLSRDEREAWLEQRISLRDRPGKVMEFQTLDGKWCRIADSRTADGGTVSIRSDITDLKERQHELERERNKAEAANKAKTDFLTNMSHELRTPLNAIIGFADVMTTGMFGDLSDRYRTYATDIGDSGRHLLSLINDLLDSAKIESGTMQLDLEEVPLSDLVRQTVTLIQPVADDSGIVLQAEPETSLVVKADQRALRQILINLLSNAVKFSHRGGIVGLSISGGADGVEVRVSDTGIGLSPKDVDRVFDRFVQVEDPMRRAHAGTGIGLPLSRALAELHGGTLHLESEVGIGTTAVFTLPAASVVETSEPADPPRRAEA